MTWFYYLERNDLIPIFMNVMFFMCIQTIFFIYVASKQFENVLKDKISFFKILLDNNPYIKSVVYEYKNQYTLNKNFDKIIYEREKYNNEILLIYCGIPMIIASIILIYILFFMKSKKKWNKVDSLSLFFVTLAYLTELFLFFCVITQYIFIGDMNLIYNFVINII
jgi:hypothetical protein